MKRIILTCLVISSITSCAQSDSTTLLTEVENKLKNKSASASSILTDKKYLPVHPSTTFRESIRKNATATVLQITTPEEPGKKIKVIGYIKNANGQPVDNALVYLYQTDARGWYAADAPHVNAYEGDTQHSRLFGYVRSDKNGKFELHTIKPSGYPRSDLPAHIHIHVWDDRYSTYVTELLFDDDERLIGRIREEANRSRYHISKPEKSAAPFAQQFSYTLLLQPK